MSTYVAKILGNEADRDARTPEDEKGVRQAHHDFWTLLIERGHDVALTLELEPLHAARVFRGQGVSGRLAGGEPAIEVRAALGTGGVS